MMINLLVMYKVGGIYATLGTDTVSQRIPQHSFN